MKLRLSHWRYYLVALTALAAVATGIAATPLRKTLTPFVTKPLGSWSLPVARSTGQATPETEFRTSSAVASRTDELTGLTALSERKLGPAGADLAQTGEVVEHGGGGQGAEQSRSARESDGWNSGKGNSGRSFSFGRWGGGTSYAGAGRAAFFGSGSVGRGTPASSASSSGSGGSGSGGAINDPGPIFNEHKSGFPELTGTKNTAPGAGGGTLSAQSTLASNPEPSTLILFGTGLATAVGSIRRRLRRQ